MTLIIIIAAITSLVMQLHRYAPRKRPDIIQPIVISRRAPIILKQSIALPLVVVWLPRIDSPVTKADILRPQIPHQGRPMVQFTPDGLVRRSKLARLRWCDVLINQDAQRLSMSLANAAYDLFPIWSQRTSAGLTVSMSRVDELAGSAQSDRSTLYSRDDISG